jgi:catalase-peroxidase
LTWQDPIDSIDYDLVSTRDVAALKKDILNSGLSVQELVRTAWASASSFRAGDKRGGANGARIALAPQKDWKVNNPKELAKVLAKLKTIRSEFNKSSSTTKISLADLIVIGGAAAIENAAKDAGLNIKVPFVWGRGDATQAQTEVNSFALLKPTADGFRNYFDVNSSYRSPTEMLIDKADQLDLTVPQMTVLVGGMRALGANTDGSDHGMLTDKPGTLSNDFFVNLLDMSTVWKKTDSEGIYQGIDRLNGKVKHTATPVDLVFGSNSELRAIAEVYAYNNSKQRFADDFVEAWNKVMMLDRFDVK